MIRIEALQQGHFALIVHTIQSMLTSVGIVVAEDLWQRPCGKLLAEEG